MRTIWNNSDGTTSSTSSRQFGMKTPRLLHRRSLNDFQRCMTNTKSHEVRVVVVDQGFQGRDLLRP